MQNLSLTNKVAIATGLLLVLWHIQVATSSKTRLSGLFMAKPGQPGYVWNDLGNVESRFFWDIADIRWKTGQPHPTFRVEAGEQPGVWVPQPGYTFVNKSVDLTVIWQADLQHPRFMGFSDKNEGAWTPVAGYKFVYKDGEIVDAVWEPNKRIDNLKISTLVQRDRYQPFPGYQFIEPDESLKVVWVPRMINTSNSQLMAGTQEGSWVVANQGSYAYRSRRGGTAFGRQVGNAAKRGVARGVEHGVERRVFDIIAN